MDLGACAFRAGLWLYPPGFRRRYGEEMEVLFEEQRCEARDREGGGGAALATLRALRAAPGGAIEVWCAVLREARSARRSRPGRDRMLRSVTGDLRDAMRGLRHNPLFALMAIGSLALGMGANATMLSLVRGLVWSELPVPHAEQMVRMFQRDTRGVSNFSYPNYLDLREQGSGVFAGVLVHDLTSFGLRSGDRTEVVHGELVSSNYFEVLQLGPGAGRLFTSLEADGSRSELPVVISHHLWQTRFGADAGIEGRRVELSGHPARIVGVAPRGFQGTKLGLAMDLWVPVRPWAALEGWGPLEERRGRRWLNVVGRLEPGVGRAEAQAAADTIAARLADQYPDTNRNVGFAVLPEGAGNFGAQGEQLTRTIGGVALLAAGMVLLVACGNVAALLLARGAARREELAVRRALGASRSRLVWLFLAESLLVSAAATALGLLLTPLASPMLASALPPLPYRFALSATPDAGVIALMAVGGLLTAVVCGLAPTLSSGSPSGLEDLSPQTRGSSSPARLRPLAALSGLTLAFCCVTLVIGGLFGRSLGAAQAITPGFETRARVTASVDAGLAGPDAMPADRFFAELVDRLARAPGVRGVAVASNLPLTDRQNQADVFDARRPPQPDEVGVQAWTARVSEDYFEVLGQPLLAGRSFTAADREGPPGAVVSRALAQRLWAEASAVGRRIRLGSAELEVIGVAPDARYEIVSEATRPALYLPFWANPTSRAEIVVLGEAAEPELVTRIAAAAREIDPGIPVYGDKSLHEHVAGSLWMFRMAAGLAAGLGLLAAGLSLAGLYGVMAHGVQQRRNEIGIRLALGATRGRILRTFLARGLRLAAAGVALGLTAGAGAAQAVRGLVVGVSPHDPLAFAGVGILVTGLALVACLAPSLTAARSDPIRTLRAE